MLSFDRDNHFIEMPLIREVGALASHLIRVLLPELAAPFSNGFVGYFDPTIEHYLFDVPIAERKRVIEPDAVADDFARKTVTRVQGRTDRQGRILYFISCPEVS